MSAVQPYIQPIDYSSVYQDASSGLLPAQPAPPAFQQKSKVGQLLQNFGGQFGGDQVRHGIQQITGGQGFGDLLGGAMKGEGPGAGLISQAMEGIGSGGGLDIGGVLNKAASGGGFDPFSMAGGALDSLADDQDATTYSVGEIGADVAGVGMGVGRVLSGDIIGGGKQLLGEVVDIGKSIFGRKKAREEQERIEKEKKDAFFKHHSSRLEQSVAQSVMSSATERASDAAQGLAAMQEKYGLTKPQGQGTVAKHGARIKYEGGGLLSSMPGTRPEMLKYIHGLNKEKFNFPVEDFKEPIYNTDYSEINKYLSKGGLVKFEDGGKPIDKLLKGDFKGLYKDYKDYRKESTKDVLEMSMGDNPMSYVLPVGGGMGALSRGLNIADKALKVKDAINVVSKTNKDGYDVRDFFSKSYTKYVDGGMTKGKFSHKENPLTVVDKQGNDTGMELTGGEGVFDNKAMSMLDKYKKNKNYNKAGKLVFSEMESWKDAGTAKYGTRIKDY